MLTRKRILIPLGFGIAGIFFLAGLYFGVMTWAEGFQAARLLFWNDRWILIPIILGFGIQAALYAVLKYRLYVPNTSRGPGGALMGASGTTSTVAMLACCAHHITDLLPILGLTAATAFLARYRQIFQWVSLGITLTGILIMLIFLIREKDRAIRLTSRQNNALETP